MGSNRNHQPENAINPPKKEAIPISNRGYSIRNTLKSFRTNGLSISNREKTIIFSIPGSGLVI